MRNILVIIAAITFSYNFVVINSLANVMKKVLHIPHYQRVRPFDCFYCLSAWTALALYFTPDAVLYPFAVFFVTATIAYKLS